MFPCLKARDAGGSMVIHTFGGYYGLSISWMLYRPNLDQSSRLQGSVYHSDVFAMIGGHDLITLWLFFKNSHNSFYDSGSTLDFWCRPCLLLRHTLPLDVLAQLQLSHHRPRGWAAQSSHQYLPGFGLNCAHHCGHLEPLPEAWKTRHGKHIGFFMSFTNSLVSRDYNNAFTCQVECTYSEIDGLVTLLWDVPDLCPTWTNSVSPDTVNTFHIQ